MGKITFLIDNNTNDLSLAVEHGLSIYFETDHQNWLYDTGASHKFVENANDLGIDLGAVDTLVLSHGHKDHTGGLESFIEVNDRANIMMADCLKNYNYYSLRHENKRDITVDHSLLTDAPRFHYLKESCWLTPSIAAVFCNCHRFASPKANHFLEVSDRNGEWKDSFDHELTLALMTPKGLVILSACSHQGALNIIESCQRFTGERRVAAFIGGMHLVDGYETEEDIAAICSTFDEIAEGATLISGHCTGDKAKIQLQNSLGNRYQNFNSGFVFEF